MSQRSINPPPSSSGGLFDLMEAFFEEKSSMMHTQIPAKVIEINYEKGWVTVQPLIKAIISKPSIFNDRKEAEYPLVYEVPLFVLSAGRGSARITMPVKIGDVGVVQFSERDTDLYLTTSGDKIVDSENYNTHSQDGNPNSLVFIPEIFTASSAKRIDSENIVVENKLSKTTHKPDGTVESTNGAVTSVINPDGSASIDNGSGSIILGTDGTVNINGFIINPDGSATSPVSVGAPTVSAITSLTVDGTEMKEHNHSAGNYIDAESRPITGSSGDPI